MLPKDPMILFSLINTKLRDFYSSLDDLCEDMDVSKPEIESILSEAGFRYDPEKNRFI